MLKVLLRSLPDLRVQLQRAVATLARPLIVAQEHDEESGGEFARRQPYRYLLEHQAPVSMVVVADDPHGGLWRDPVGDLAEATFPDRRSAMEAASGYLLFFERARPDFLKRDLWDRYADVAALIVRLDLPVPLPPRAPAPKPKAKKGRARSRSGGADEPGRDPSQHRTGPRRPAPPPGQRRRTDPDVEAPAEEEPEVDSPPDVEAPAVPSQSDPFAVLGLPATATEDEVKKAFRALIVQYHPDKVAHLAAEFRVLAETRSRELTDAYERAQKRARHEA